MITIDNSVAEPPYDQVKRQIAAMVASENVPHLTEPGNEAELGCALAALAVDPAARAAIGQANRARAEAEYDEGVMLKAYDRLYAGAMGRVSLLA